MVLIKQKIGYQTTDFWLIMEQPMISNLHILPNEILAKIFFLQKFGKN
jgi:hypothetical protein